MGFGGNNQGGRGGRDGGRERAPDPDGLRESRVITINRVTKVANTAPRSANTATEDNGKSNNIIPST